MALLIRWARRQAACFSRPTRRSSRPSTATSNPGPITNLNPSPSPSPSPHPNLDPSQAFYSSLSREGREGYDAILSTSISKVLSSVNFIAEAQLDANALRNCGELCTYLPLRSGAMVFEQVHAYYRMYGFVLTVCTTWSIFAMPSRSPYAWSWHASLLRAGRSSRRFLHRAQGEDRGGH